MYEVLEFFLFFGVFFFQFQWGLMEKKYNIQGGGRLKRGVKEWKKSKGKSVAKKRERRWMGSRKLKRGWCFVLKQSAQQDIAAVSFHLFFFFFSWMKSKQGCWGFLSLPWMVDKLPLSQSHFSLRSPHPFFSQHPRSLHLKDLKWLYVVIHKTNLWCY